MKTFFIEDNNPGDSPEAWFFLPDSSLTNAGKPFFIPEFSSEIEARPVVLLKVNRLGKTIAPRFAGRYFSEVAFGVGFQAADLRERLSLKGLPADRAYSFDRSLIVSEFLPKTEISPSDSPVMLKNGEKVSSVPADLSESSIGLTFKAVSAENTLKMGDLIIPFVGKGTKVIIGDILELATGAGTILRIEIR
ncbi:MAG: 2-hydroxyhepta-2,4-diene-1,7-dioate isomerase [Muribaculaceae bacterium]|nr:2-hydroxyhepta-2,4-diene-1,7-dioate isomerase [Muribaculaceae bacterium]